MHVSKTTSADLTPYLHSSPPRQSSVSAISDSVICNETAGLTNDVMGTRSAVVVAGGDVTDNESAVVPCDVTDNDVTTDDDATVVGGGGAYQVLLQTSLTIGNLNTTAAQQPREVYKMAATSTSAPSVGEMLNQTELLEDAKVVDDDGMVVDETDDVFLKEDDHRVADREMFCGSLMTEHYVRNVGQIIIYIYCIFLMSRYGGIGKLYIFCRRIFFFK